MTTTTLIDTDSLTDMTAPSAYRDAALSAARKVVVAARSVQGEGRYGTRKIFLCAVAAELGMSVARLAPLLALWNAAGVLSEAGASLSRADLVGAMDPRMVAASHVRCMGTDWHFLTMQE